jgi:hypothetical protein
MNAGIVIRHEDPVARSKAGQCGISVEIRPDWALPWPGTLFVAPGTCVPWDLVAVGFQFLARWDVAAPFWRAGTLAKDLGTPAERERTAHVLHDLRVPVYSHELLFVRNSPAGQAFLSAWRAECGVADKGLADKGDERLAFLRALYAVKPAFCVLPRLWLADLAQREIGDLKAAQRRHLAQPEKLIVVEVLPGRFIKCHERDRAKLIERYQVIGARQARAAHGH